jgi:hypothetical protein
VNAIPDEIETLTGELMATLRSYREAKELYADAYERRKVFDRSAAEAQAELDAATRTSAWLQGEAAALGAALAGLCLSQMGEPR